MTDNPAGTPHTASPDPAADELLAKVRDLRGAFSDYLGLEIVSASATELVARWPIGPHLHQPFGIVHGGAHAAVVETVGSIGASLSMDGRGYVVGVNNNTDFYRAVREGVLDVVATALHQGRSQQVWQVEIRDEQQRLVARGTLRLQNLYTSSGQS